MRIPFGRSIGLMLTLSPLSTAASAQTPDANFYYRLSTEFRGTSLPLDVFNAGPKNNQTHLARKGNFSGQFWRFQPAADGHYKLTTDFRGPGMCLDIYNGGPRNNQPHLTACANLSGQAWKLVEDGSWVRLKTQFRGDEMCLDIFNGGENNNQPHLTNCANLTGQKWKLTKTDRPAKSRGAAAF